MSVSIQHGTSGGSADNLSRALRRLQEASDSAEKEAFASRALYAIARLLDTQEAGTLLAATGAASDYDVLLQALEHPAALRMLDAGPLAKAKLRGLRYRELLMNAEGGTYSSQEAADVLGLTRQAVDKRRRSGRLIGLSTGRRGYAYPAWQFDQQHGTVPGLEAVLADLQAHDPWMQLSFMVNPTPYLADRTPLDVLRAGEVEAVRRTAQAFGEQGAA